MRVAQMMLWHFIAAMWATAHASFLLSKTAIERDPLTGFTVAIGDWFFTFSVASLLIILASSFVAGFKRGVARHRTEQQSDSSQEVQS